MQYLCVGVDWHTTWIVQYRIIVEMYIGVR